MSFLLENIQTPLSEQTAYILGGIGSACSYNEEQSAWLLPVIHNPGKGTSTDLQSHQNSLKKILSGMYAKFIKKTDDNYKKYMQPNKQGFVFLVSSATIKTPENLIETFSEHIMIASEKVRCAFITGAFDGRSSLDKHTRMLSLDEKHPLCSDLIINVLKSLKITASINKSRDRITGGNPRKNQIRISAADVPEFAKTVGLISPTRVKDIENASISNFIEEKDNSLSGLIKIKGLRLSKQQRKLKKVSVDKRSHEAGADQKLIDEISSTKITKPTKEVSYTGKPKKKISAVTQSQTTTFPRDKKVSLKALKIANYTCEIDAQHQTFIRKKDDLPYTEPHHLVPMAYSDDFDVSLDIEENIVSLCSTCHNQVHYGKDIEIILKPLYERRKDLLARVGIYITYAELLKMYK